MIDIAVGMYEDNRVTYLGPQKCTSKEQEVVNSASKDDKHIAIDSSGPVRVRDKLGKMDADISSDMFLQLALMRRGLALDPARFQKGKSKGKGGAGSSNCAHARCPSRWCSQYHVW